MPAHANRPARRLPAACLALAILLTTAASAHAQEPPLVATGDGQDSFYCEKRRLGYWFYCTRPRPAETPEPPRFNDPGTTRISFRRGSIGETVSGTIGRQRSFVLRTLAGQYLSASVRSTDGCVTFTDGGSTTGYPTGLGDSYLYLRNNCAGAVRFRLFVTVR